MSRWFRFYDEVLDDPKVQLLSAEQFRMWVNCLCVASKSGGKLPDNGTLAFKLRMSVHDLETRLSDLILAGLIDIEPDGSKTPHNWRDRQYVSDSATSTERVKRYREKRKSSGLAQQHYLNPAKKDEVLSKTDGLCAYCGTDENITIDHKVPVGRGGDDDMDNLIAACRPCNAEKRNMTHDEYLSWAGRGEHMKHRGNVTETPEQPHQSRTDQKTDTNQNPDQKTRERAKPGFEIGNVTGSEVPEVEPELIRRAEGLGLNARAIEGECYRSTIKNPSAYFQSLVRKKLKAKLPGLSDDVIGRGLCGDLKAYGVLMNLVLLAEST